MTKDVENPSRRNLLKAGAAAGVAAALPAGSAQAKHSDEVLDKDYFSVSDAEMRRIQPVLTVVDGKIVHEAGVI